jgi:hypothetical protein
LVFICSFETLWIVDMTSGEIEEVVKGLESVSSLLFCCFNRVKLCLMVALENSKKGFQRFWRPVDSGSWRKYLF